MLCCFCHGFTFSVSLYVAGIKDYEMEIIAHGVEQFTVVKDEILLQQGESSDSMYILKDGLLQISVRFLL